MTKVALIALALASGGGATATLSNPAHGARTALDLRVPSFLQCGRALGSVDVTFPAGAHVPAAIPAADVTVAGRPAQAVSVAGRTVTVTAPRPTGVLCHSITQGAMQVTFTRAAGLANPGHAGTYVLGVRRNGTSYAVRLKIS